MAKSGRGGKRAGAGRKRIPNLLTYSMRIAPEQMALLRMWGGGNASAGLRWLINAAEMFVRKRD